MPKRARFVQRTERERSPAHSSRRTSKSLALVSTAQARGRRSHERVREALCRRKAV